MIIIHFLLFWSRISIFETNLLQKLFFWLENISNSIYQGFNNEVQFAKICGKICKNFKWVILSLLPIWENFFAKNYKIDVYLAN